MSFENTRNQETQEHFYIVIVSLPIITGTCELVEGVEGYGTPKSCPIQDGTSETEIKNYAFATSNAPLDVQGIASTGELFYDADGEEFLTSGFDAFLVQSEMPTVEPTVYRCITRGGVKESATELQPGKGLAIRGRASITFQNFTGLDPNDERASGASVANQGTFFGKFLARNIVENKSVYIIKYRKADNIDYGTDGETTQYVGKSLKNNGNGTFTLECADELSRVDLGTTQFPPAQSGRLRADLSSTGTSIQVYPQPNLWTLFDFPYVVRLGEELIIVTGVTDPTGPNATLDVATQGGENWTRGDSIGGDDLVFTNLLSSQTLNVPHTEDDDVFVCFPVDGVNFADLLRAILLFSGVPNGFIPLQDWYDEVAEWHPTGTTIDLFVREDDTDTVLKKLLGAFLMDMWYDPVDREIKLKAITNWQEVSAVMRDDIEITKDSFKIAEQESLRFSRAYIQYDKPNKILDDAPENYDKGSFAVNAEVETFQFYDKSKTKVFDRNTTIQQEDADLLVQRFVQRFGTMPYKYSWSTMEKYLTFKVGDVVSVESKDAESASGLPATNLRAQITRIQPQDTQYGRQYSVNAVTYQPAALGLSGNPIITINGGTDINLYVQFGGPREVTNYTVILDGGLYSASNVGVASIIAGSFAVGSTLTIITRNGADWQGKGGNGGAGGTAPTILNDTTNGLDGESGGVCYDAQGIQTTIYLSTPDPEGGTADGYLRAPGGGGGGSGGKYPSEPRVGGNGGGGGGGSRVGIGGPGGSSPDIVGVIGDSGDILGIGGAGGDSARPPLAGGDGGAWGLPGLPSDTALGGVAGKGILKGGGIVTLIGEDGTRFINGGGDAPDLAAFNDDFDDSFRRGD